MADLSAALAQRVERLAADRESGASDILQEAIALVREARISGVPALTIAAAICRAQPSLASIWNAALEAVASEQDPDRFEQFARRVARASDALARFARDCLTVDGSGPLRLVTISCSRTVRVVIDAIRQQRPIRVSCSESRPALEGRRLAAQLASAGVPVTCFGDAAIGHALAAADAVILGADAVGPEWFLNKSGTRMLAAAAAQQGVPVYVAATRDKFVGHAVGARLVIREGTAAEVWDGPPTGVGVRNPYFESTPLDLVTGIISDVGVLGAGMVPEVCNAAHDPSTLRALEDIGR